MRTSRKKSAVIDVTSALSTLHAAACNISNDLHGLKKMTSHSICCNVADSIGASTSWQKQEGGSRPQTDLG